MSSPLRTKARIPGYDPINGSKKPSEYAAKTHSSTATTPLRRQDSDGAGQRILVVEEAPDVRDYVLQTLSPEGYTVPVASNGREALSLLNAAEDVDNTGVDLVLLNVYMSDMTGRDMVQLVREAMVKQVSIILLSNTADETPRSNPVGALANSQGGLIEFLPRAQLQTSLKERVRSILLRRVVIQQQTSQQQQTRSKKKAPKSRYAGGAQQPGINIQISPSITNSSSSSKKKSESESRASAYASSGERAGKHSSAKGDMPQISFNVTYMPYELMGKSRNARYGNSERVTDDDEISDVGSPATATPLQSAQSNVSNDDYVSDLERTGYVRSRRRRSMPQISEAGSVDAAGDGSVLGGTNDVQNIRTDALKLVEALMCADTSGKNVDPDLHNQCLSAIRMALSERRPSITTLDEIRSELNNLFEQVNKCTPKLSGNGSRTKLRDGMSNSSLSTVSSIPWGEAVTQMPEALLANEAPVKRNPSSVSTGQDNGNRTGEEESVPIGILSRLAGVRVAPDPLEPLYTFEVQETQNVEAPLRTPTTPYAANVFSFQSRCEPLYATSEELRERISNWSPEQKAAATSMEFRALQYSKEYLMLCPIYWFDKLGLFEVFNLEPSTLYSFVSVLPYHYNKNPYHNFQHCIDVTQYLFLLISSADMQANLSKLEQAALLVAGLCHDLEHPGTNNKFQVDAQTEFALRYNDISVLENHHCSTAFHIFGTYKNADLLGGLTPETRKQVRTILVRTILATDMAKHFDTLNTFKAKVNDNNFSLDEGEDRMLFLGMLTKCADISNIARPHSVARVWADALMREFRFQISEEERLVLPISPFFPPNSTQAKGQQFFINLFGVPLLTALSEQFASLKWALQSCNENMAAWKAIQEADEQREKMEQAKEEEEKEEAAPAEEEKDAEPMEECEADDGDSHNDSDDA